MIGWYPEVWYLVPTPVCRSVTVSKWYFALAKLFLTPVSLYIWFPDTLVDNLEVSNRLEKNFAGLVKASVLITVKGYELDLLQAVSAGA